MGIKMAIRRFIFQNTTEVRILTDHRNVTFAVNGGHGRKKSYNDLVKFMQLTEFRALHVSGEHLVVLALSRGKTEVFTA